MLAENLSFLDTTAIADRQSMFYITRSSCCRQQVPRYVVKRQVTEQLVVAGHRLPDFTALSLHVLQG